MDFRVTGFFVAAFS